MQRIESTKEQDDEAIALVVRELEFYDSHPTEVSELFIPQSALRRIIQMVVPPISE